MIAFAALLMAGSAAFFSVTGLSKLSAGTGMAIIIFAASMEFSKLVMASFLHKRWKFINPFMRAFSTIAVMVMIMLTSLGIYGVLSSGYAKTSADYQLGQSEITLKESEKIGLEQKVARYKDMIVQKNDRMKTLAGQRSSQESRLDSLYNRRVYSGAQRTENLIGSADGQIKKLNGDIDSLNKLIEMAQVQTASVDSSIIVMKTASMQGESAPLQYVAKMVGKPMDTVVNWFFLLIVFIFDPIAIMLILAYNIELERVKKEKEEALVFEGSVEVPGIVEVVESEVIAEPKPEVVEVAGPIEKIVEEVSEPIIEETMEETVGETVEEIEVAPEIVTYTPNEEGVFKKGETKEEKKKNLYLKLLDVLYENGKVKKNDLLPTFMKFSFNIASAGIIAKEQEVDDFLKICILFKVIDINAINRVALKNYEDAVNIFNQLEP